MDKERKKISAMTIIFQNAEGKKVNIYDNNVSDKRVST
jgi:hypothetical protein